MMKTCNEAVKVYFQCPSAFITLIDEQKIIKITCTFGNWQLRSFVV